MAFLLLDPGWCVHRLTEKSSLTSRINGMTTNKKQSIILQQHIYTTPKRKQTCLHIMYFPPFSQQNDCNHPPTRRPNTFFCVCLYLTYGRLGLDGLKIGYQSHKVQRCHPACGHEESSHPSPRFSPSRYDFLSRCKFSSLFLQLVSQWLNFPYSTHVLKISATETKIREMILSRIELCLTYGRFGLDVLGYQSHQTC